MEYVQVYFCKFIKCEFRKNSQFTLDSRSYNPSYTTHVQVVSQKAERLITTTTTSFVPSPFMHQQEGAGHGTIQLHVHAGLCLPEQAMRWMVAP